MKILLPPYLRIVAVALCVFSLTPWAFDLDNGFPFLGEKEHVISKVLFPTGLLLLALAGKRENKQRWWDARKKAVRFMLIQIVLFYPLMAFLFQEKGSWSWPQPISVVTHILLFFAGFTMLYFYTEKKSLIAG